MSKVALVWVCLAYLGDGRRTQTSNAFNPSAMLNPVLSPLRTAGGHSPVMQGQGFGTPTENKGNPKKKRENKLPKLMEDRFASEMKEKKAADGAAGVDTVNQAAANQFDEMKKAGSPEYMVFVRENPEEGEQSKWYVVGGIAVPRTGSIDKAVAAAVFENEEDLLKGAYKRYPFLKTCGNPLEYGFRLAEFEDDPILVADRKLTEPESNPIKAWFNNIDNPFNDGKGWFNPAAKK